MYTCGPTVYRYVHIGNLRSYLMADWLRRSLERTGLIVGGIKNITDVGHMRQELLDRGEDKMIAAALAEGKTTGEIAAFYTEAFRDDEAAMNIQPAATFPRATDHVPQMISLIQDLMTRGHAYEVDGNVYFDVRSLPGYGKLSANRLDDLQGGDRAEADVRKRSQADFALWKAAEAGRMVKWPSPWGDGFRARTSSARRWRCTTSGPSSTSTRVASTTSSPTTKTRSRRARPPTGRPFVRRVQPASTCSLMD